MKSGLALLAAVFLTSGCAASADTAATPPTSTAVTDTVARNLGECGSLDANTVSSEIQTRNAVATAPLAEVVRTPILCRWAAPDGSASADFHWYRGTEISARRATLTAPDVRDVTVAGRPGYQAHPAGGSCEVAVASGPADFFSWTVSPGTASPDAAGPDTACDIATALAQRTLN